MLRKQFKRFMNIVHLLLVALVAAGTPATGARAAEPRHQASVTTGDLSRVDGSVEFVVQAAVTSGDTVYLVLDDAASAIDLVLRIPRAALRDATLALGDHVTVAADGFGWLVQSAGRTLAVVAPEAIGALR